jgi:hypothetical protein
MGNSRATIAVNSRGRPVELSKLASRARAGPKIAVDANIQMSEMANATQKGVNAGRRLRLETKAPPPGSFSLAGTARTGWRLPFNESSGKCSACRSASRRLARLILRGSPVCVAINLTPAAYHV